MERTKILFGAESRADSSSTSSGTVSRFKFSHKQANNENSSKLLELLKSTAMSINRSELINALKSCSKSDINNAISAMLAQELSQAEQQQNQQQSLSSSLASLASQQTNKQSTNDTNNIQNSNTDVTDKNGTSNVVAPVGGELPLTATGMISDALVSGSFSFLFIFIELEFKLV
jgi:hypothetical protein